MPRLKFYITLLFLTISIVVDCTCCFATRQYKHDSVHVGVAVPEKNIKKGELIQCDDFIHKNISVKSGSHHEYLTLEHINQANKLMYANKDLKHGMPVKLSDLRFDILVRKGQTITGRFRKNNLTIEAPCIAMSDGKANDVIKVRNANTNKILQGYVMDDGTVSMSGK